MMATSSFLLLFACSGTINYHKTLIIMPKKEIRNWMYNRPKWKGCKMDTTNKTIQSQAQSIKDMIRNHVQGTLDPSQYNDGLYDDENIDHETDVEHRSQPTLLDALDYANENKMSKDEIQDFVDTFGTPPDMEVQNDKESLREPLNEAEQNATETSE